MSEHPAATFENRGATHTLRVVMPVQIDDYHLAAIIITAIEGGINYWCPEASLIEPYAIEKDTNEVWNEFFARNIVLGGSARVIEDCGESDDPVEHILTADKLLDGFQKWLAFIGDKGHTPPCWTDGGDIDWDIDASDADNIIQFALFGELVYG